MKRISLLLIGFFLLNCSLSIAQKTEKLSPVLVQRILDKDMSSEFKVWIYFTDKGEDLAQKLITAEQAIGQRSLERRARSLKNKPLVSFYDIPVSETYIDGLTPYLTKLRHQSKWLNAVSAIVSKENLQEIEALDFVESIDIVRTGKRTEAYPTSSIYESTCHTAEKTGVYDLDYGPSLTQLEQINVPRGA